MVFSNQEQGEIVESRGALARLHAHIRRLRALDGLLRVRRMPPRESWDDEVQALADAIVREGPPSPFARRCSPSWPITPPAQLPLS
eukprot:10607231-Alexandrium_andersonii.AAC.1